MLDVRAACLPDKSALTVSCLQFCSAGSYTGDMEYRGEGRATIPPVFLHKYTNPQHRRQPTPAQYSVYSSADQM